MNELINITKATINNEEVNAVSGRELHKKLEVQTRFNDWMPRRIEEYGFEEGRDFTVLKNEHGRNISGKFSSKEYIISLDMAKELAMVENNEQGKKIRRYFIEVEKKFRKQTSDSLANSEVFMATLCDAIERASKAEAERDEYKRNIQRIARASKLNFGEISNETGLPKDIVVASHCKSNRRRHKPQYGRYIQLMLPLRELVEECYKQLNVQPQFTKIG